MKRIHVFQNVTQIKITTIHTGKITVRSSLYLLKQAYYFFIRFDCDLICFLFAICLVPPFEWEYCVCCRDAESERLSLGIEQYVLVNIYM